MKLNENLTVIKDLGSGAFGQVFLCNYQKDGFSKLVAVKKVNNQDNKEKVFKEALINSELSHPNIVQIYNVEYDTNNNILFIYEYVEGITLREHLESTSKLSLGEAVFIFNCLLRGIELAHSKGIIHHDISPRNIILSIHGEVKILDFGLAKLQGSYQNDVSEISGSISYYDPYLIQNKKSYDKEADIYSSVLIFYEMLTGRRFFPSSSPLETIEFLKEFDKVDEIDLEDIQEEDLRSVLRQGLDRKREFRLSISEIKNLIKDFKMEHPVIALGQIPKNAIVENTVSRVKASENFKSKKRMNSVIGVSFVLVLAIWGATFFQADEIFFHVKNDSGLYSAKLSDLDKDTTSYKDLSQLFNNKSCDYYYASFLTAIVLLDAEYSAKTINVKNKIETRIKFLNRFYNTKSFMEQKCVINKHQKLSELIDSFDQDYTNFNTQKNDFNFKLSSAFQNIVNEFEKNDELFKTYDEAALWLKNNYYNVRAVIKSDIFRVPKEQLNLDECSLYAEYIIVDSIINTDRNMKDLDYIRVFGVDEEGKLSITGLYKDKLIFEDNNTNIFINSPYCIYELGNTKTRIFSGKLQFSKIK